MEKRKPAPVLKKATVSDTAKKLGYKSHRTVVDAVAVHKAVQSGAVPGLEEAKTMQEAVKMVKDTARLEAAKMMALRRGPTADISNPMQFFGDKIILGNCLEKMKELQPGICSLFITDPPFGLELDNLIKDRGEIISKTRGVYSDKEQEILNLIHDVIQEILSLAAAYQHSAHHAIGEVLCPKYTYVGWTTHGHSGGDAPLHAFGPGKPSGVLAAPDIARVCADAMGFSLPKLTQRLFVDAARTFGGDRITIDRRDPANPVARIAAGGPPPSCRSTRTC